MSALGLDLIASSSYATILLRDYWKYNLISMFEQISVIILMKMLKHETSIGNLDLNNLKSAESGTAE